MCKSVTDRITRLMRLSTRIKLLPYYNARDLAEEFEISLRTIRRDLNTLRAAGFPITYDQKRQGYQVSGQCEPGQTPIDDDRLAMLALAAHLSPLCKIGHY